MFCGFPIPPFEMRRGVFLALLLIISPAVYADESVDLGTVVVEDTEARETPKLDRTAAATIIIPDKSSDLAPTVPQLLEQSAGVHIKRYGGLDDFSAISLRGSSASQVQIYLDDIPIATSQGEPIDLSIVPLSTVGSIEVYRGGSPGSVPDSTAGGVVVIHSKKRPDKTEAVLRNTGGSFATYKGTASITQPFKKFSYVAAYERFQSEGDFTYLDNKGTTFNKSDDEMVTRKNNDFASNSLFTKLMFDASEKLGISLSNIFFNKDQGIPGVGNRQSLNARLETWRDMVSVSGDKEWSKLNGHADLYFDFLNNQFRDPQAEIGLGVQDNDDNTYRFGANLRTAYNLGAHQQLRGFVSERTEFFLPKNRAAAPEDGAHSHRSTVSVGAEDEVSVFKERLSIVPSLRFANVFNYLSNDDPSVAAAGNATNRKSYHQLSAKVGMSFRIADEFYFKGNFYRGFRNPTFSELFGDRGTIVGNPSLSPEEAINFDAGFSFYHGTKDSPLKLNAEVAYFRSHLDDLIQFMQTSQYTIRAENIGRALIQGVEVSANISWKDGLSSYASYTFQDAKDISSSSATNGKYLPGRPRNELAFGAAWNEDWFKWFATKLFGDIHYMSGNYLDTQNLLSVNHRSLISTGVSAIFVKNITLSFVVRNLIDDRIEDLVGFPLPGRSYWATAELKI